MSDGIEPPGQFSGILLFPGFNAHDLTQFPEEEAVQNDVHKDIVALVEFIHELVQPADGVGGFPFFSVNLLSYLFEQGGLCRLLFHEVEQGGVGADELLAEKMGKQGKRKVLKTINLKEFVNSYSVISLNDKTVLTVVLTAGSKNNINPNLFVDALKLGDDVDFCEILKQKMMTEDLKSFE